MLMSIFSRFYSFFLMWDYGAAELPLQQNCSRPRFLDLEIFDCLVSFSMRLIIQYYEPAGGVLLSWCFNRDRQLFALGLRTFPKIETSDIFPLRD